LETTGGCGGVDPLAQRDERHSEGLEFVEQQDQVPQVAPSRSSRQHTRTSNRRRFPSATS
jgi:hypothetical protein